MNRLFSSIASVMAIMFIYWTFGNDFTRGYELGLTVTISIIAWVGVYFYPGWDELRRMAEGEKE